MCASLVGPDDYAESLRGYTCAAPGLELVRYASELVLVAGLNGVPAEECSDLSVGVCEAHWLGFSLRKVSQVSLAKVLQRVWSS